MAAVASFNDRLVEEISEVIDVTVGSEDHVAATSAVAAIGPAFRHKFLAAKTGAPTPAISRLRENFDPINEHAAFKVPLPATRVIPSGARDLSIEVGNT
jgi:hypothetical protein